MVQQIIALITDFGLADNYVGIMKGVMKSINPQCEIIDITHNIQPQNISEASYQLLTAFDYFPDNTVFCIVVDPGVGTDRRAIAVQLDNDKLVCCPDNGIISGLLINNSIKHAIELNNKNFFLSKVSNTFHGRDIYSPVSAYLSSGVDLTEFGNKISPDSLVQLKLSKIEKNKSSIKGTFIHSDNFGNLISNITQEMVEQCLKENLEVKIIIGEIEINKIHNTFSDVSINEPVAYIGSSGFLEIAVRNNNAKEYLFNNRIPKNIIIRSEN